MDRAQPTNPRTLPPDAKALLPILDLSSGLRLFLDYDGTLADFAPTPEHVNPDRELVDLLTRLAAEPRIEAAIISGRRLGHIQKLVPVPGLLLAGSYGIELQTPEGTRLDRLDLDVIRPTLDVIKPQWESLIASKDGFFLEDKGWTLALHARFAREGEADQVLTTAHRQGVEAASEAPPGTFRLLGGHRFLEIGPTLAHKGRTVEHLLEQDSQPGAVPLYLGDDDKDEEAFDIVQAWGGFAIVVTAAPRQTTADFRLASPQATRRWLERLLALFAPHQGREAAEPGRGRNTSDDHHD